MASNSSSPSTNSTVSTRNMAIRESNFTNSSATMNNSTQSREPSTNSITIQGNITSSKLNVQINTGSMPWEPLQSYIDPSLLISNMTLRGNTLTNSKVYMYQHVKQSTPREPPRSYGLLRLPTIVDKREADIRKLHALISDHHKVVITGIGGLGKTTLANLCARKWMENGTYQHVLFINLETEESASGVFKRLAEIVLNSQVYSDSTIKEIYERYNAKKTLLILDNIEQNSSLLRQYYPSEDLINIDILGTSQFTELKRLFHLYPLQVLSKGASFNLVMDIFKNNNIKEHSTVDIDPVIYDLVDKLESHPLALQHAAALIIDMCTYDDMSLEQCLNKYMEHFETQLKQKFPTDQPSEYRNSASVYAALALNIEKATIGKEHVKSLLHCMTYLDPAHIDIKIFYKVSTFTTNDIKESLRQLTRYSLISVDGDVVSMHRLVPQVCHTMLTADDKIENLKILLDTFFYYTDNHWHFSIKQHCSFLIEHFKMEKQELAAYYIDAFYNNDHIKERLTARLQMIDCVISDAKGWSVEQCCVFAGHETFYEYFNGTGNAINSVEGCKVGFVQIIRNSSSYLFDFCNSILELYEDNNQLNEPVFKDLSILSICAAFGIRVLDFIKFIEIGCDVNVQDINGMTPILWAAKNISYDIVFYLHRHGAKCDVRYKEVLTAAAAGDSVSLLRLLQTSEVSFATGEYRRTLLWWAADKGHHDIVRVLFQRDTDTSVADPRGNTLLHMVSRAGYDETVSQFIRPAVVNNRNNDGYTALMLATDGGHDKIVSQLIHAEANVNIVGSDGNTALILAASKGHDKIITQLARADANINIVDTSNRTALYWAVKHGHREMFTELLNLGAHVDTADKDGSTPLLMAAQHEHHEIAMHLIKKDASVNAVDYLGNTPLYWAAMRGDHELVTELVNRGARVDTANKHGSTPLLAAAQHEHHDIAMYLIEKDASVNAVDYLGNTPLYWATMRGDCELVTELVNRDAHVDTANKHGSTPLLAAAEFKHRKISMYLMEKDASVNAVDGDGRTNLYWAAKHGDRELVTKLVNRNAHVGTAAKDGSTPLLVATKYKHREIAMYLIEKGASVNAVDGEGDTPLLFAAKHGDYELARKLINRGAQTDPPANNRGETPLSCAQRNEDDRMEHIITSKRRRRN